MRSRPLAAHARAMEAAARVDSIVVEPAVIELRVGETFPREELRVSGCDAAGAPVPHFAPLTWLLPNRVASLDAGGVHGLAPGAVDRWMALRRLARRLALPALLELLPERAAGALDCGVCGGVGYREVPAPGGGTFVADLETPVPLPCPACGSLGWV